VGTHLVAFLTEKGIDVHGASRAQDAPKRRRYRHHAVDLRDGAAVRTLVKKVKPGRIYHLAAQSSMARSWKNPVETVTENYSSQFHLFEAVRETRLKTKIHVASSSEVYGKVAASALPVSECEPVAPVSPYGVSKGLQELLSRQYASAFGLSVVVTRAFSHTGPGQSDVFVAPSFARQLAAIERGDGPAVIRVGNLSAVRDFTDVRDVVKAYWLALEKGAVGETYNICSGKGRRVAEILDAYLRLSPKRIRVEKDRARFRPLDVAAMVGDASRFRSRTGWKPQIPFSQTMSDLLEYWRRFK
jgi:GDP-4-dehydro-6-deoxy-D-mannose reductase